MLGIPKMAVPCVVTQFSEKSDSPFVGIASIDAVIRHKLD